MRMLNYPLSCNSATVCLKLGKVFLVNFEKLLKFSYRSLYGEYTLTFPASYINTNFGKHSFEINTTRTYLYWICDLVTNVSSSWFIIHFFGYSELRDFSLNFWISKLFFSYSQQNLYIYKQFPNHGEQGEGLYNHLFFPFYNVKRNDDSTSQKSKQQKIVLVYNH